MKPTLTQIKKFFMILEENFNAQLFKNAEIFPDQLESFYKYGEFFAQVGEEHYEEICQKLSIALTNYNLSSQESSTILQDSWDYEKVSDSLKKAKAFKKTIETTETLIENKRTEKFLTLKSLLDEYIIDLEKISNYSSAGPTKIVPPSHFGKRAKRTKTPIKKLFKDIIDKYQITDHSPNSKKLIDSL